jgi:hypothetical protein
MHTKISWHVSARKQSRQRRIDKCNIAGCELPRKRSCNIRYELAERTQGRAPGGARAAAGAGTRPGRSR